MNIINNILKEQANLEEDEIIIKNEFYPLGLTKNKIYKYYLENKNLIIKETDNNPIAIFFLTKLNNYIVKRNIEGKNIILSEKNYNKIITRRTLSVGVEQGNKIKYWMIDIDTDKTINENEKKNCVNELINFFKKEDKIINYKITNSSTSFHVYGYLKNLEERNKSIIYLISKLNNQFQNKYRINNKGKTNIINLDISTMFQHGINIFPGSLNLNATICMDITKNWKTFDRKDSILK